MLDRIERPQFITIALGVLALVLSGHCNAIAQTPPASSNPMLTTHWYQDGPFAMYTPKNDRVGCWSTAIAQIMYFHRMQPFGQVQYTCSNGTIVDEDLSKYSFTWEQFVDRMSDATPQVNKEAVARYSFTASVVVRKDFGTGSYKRLLNAVQDLENHYAVNSAIYVNLGKKLPFSNDEVEAKLRQEKIDNLIDREQTIQLISTEVDARRPVYFHFSNTKDFGHSVVIDGYRLESDRFFVHINFGSNEDEYSKWYDLFTPISQPDDIALRAYITIKPKFDQIGKEQKVHTDNSQKVDVQRLRQALPELLTRFHVPSAAIAIIEKGSLAATIIAGTREPGKLADETTLYNVASLTKPIFAMAALSLVDQGTIGLDESLAPYWVDPDLISDTRHKQLTARIILGHRTGFPNWRNGNKLSIQFDPGSKVQYSGEGFEYLRKAIEVKTGQTLNEIVTENVFMPFGMDSSSLVWKPELSERFAVEHDAQGNVIEVPKHYIAGAADDLLATIGDYGKFAAEVSKGGRLSDLLFKQTITPQAENASTVKPTGPIGFGLAWTILRYSHGTALVHSGSDRGVRAIVLIIPEAQEGIVILTNGDNGGSIIESLIPIAFADGHEMVELFTGRK